MKFAKAKKPLNTGTYKALKKPAKKTTKTKK